MLSPCWYAKCKGVTERFVDSHNKIVNVFNGNISLSCGSLLELTFSAFKYFKIILILGAGKNMYKNPMLSLFIENEDVLT